MIDKKKNMVKTFEGTEIKTGNKKRKKIYSFLIAVFILLLLGGVGYLGYNYMNLQKEIKAMKDPKAAQELIKKQIKEVVKKVGMHMVLPTGEEPTLAAISDIDSLVKEQPFYSGCENGDQILIYRNAKIGIVYSPTKDRIMKVGPVFEQDENAAGTTGSASTNK